MPKPGTVYLVGGGPGDPELTTVRARNLLRNADLVMYDALIHRDQLRYCRADADMRYVGKRAGRVAERQAAINEQLVAAARAGKRVVRLKGGDPYLFGRGSEEAQYLRQHNVPFEVVPGVPSPLAATAYAGISLTHRDLASSIAYVTATESSDKASSAHDWSKLATATQTLVIFMGVRKLSQLMKKLIANGRPADCPAAVIQSASLPSQRTVIGTVGDIAARVEAAGVGMPALTVVGEVVGLRSELRWYDTQPLFGRTVAVTRSSEQAPALSAALRRAGALPLEFASIEIAPPKDPEALSSCVRSAGSYDWIVFTSVNGVRAFFDELQAQQADIRRLRGARVAAIGPATRDALLERGLRADAMPPEYRGEAVVEAIAAASPGGLDGMRILIPRAEVAREVLPDGLRTRGATVDVVAAYRSIPPEPARGAALRAAIEAGEIDVITFTSPSTVQNTLKSLGKGSLSILKRITIASIGPITADAVRDAGLDATITASDYTVPGLVAALEHHFSQELAQ